MNLVIAGGGTGGHVFAGVAIAQEFKDQNHGNRVLFIGSESGLETRLVPKAGFELITVKLGKLVGQSIFSRIRTLFQIPLAVIKCMRALRAFKAEIVIGVGGYAAGPCIVAAKILRIPTGVLEQNSVMGFTNRLSAKMASQVFLAFAEIPPGILASKCLLTGNPSRSHMQPAAVKPSKPFIVFAFGGSQGATGINKLMTEAAKLLTPERERLRFIHQTGPKDYDWVLKAYADIGFPAETHRFIDDMQAMYNKASLVVCRAGASTISELGATRNAAVFIPFPFAAGNHQEINARAVEKAGAARVLIQEKTTGEEFAELIRRFMDNPQELELMRKHIAQFHKPDAARRIVENMKARVLGLGR